MLTRHLPNAVTCLNVASGVLAIIFASRGEAPMAGLPAWQWGFIFICIAAVADFLDGFVARLLHAYSDMGKELDSLCDLVSFGVAPAILLFNCMEANETLPWLKWLAVIIPVAGALRLAKFNIDTRQTTSFIGLPIPANAIFWIGFVALVRQQQVDFLCQWYWYIPLVLLESWLMVSEVPLFSLKFKTWGWTGNARRWLLIAAAVVLVFCLGWSGLLWLILFYVALSLTARSQAAQ